MRQALVLPLIALLSCSSPTKPDPTPPEPEKPEAPPKTADQIMVESLAALAWNKLGHPVIRWDAIPAVTAPKDKPHKLLVVLVEFDDFRFERFRKDKDQGAKLAAYYKEQLFDTEYARENSLSHYYAEQSDGAYHVDGIVLPPVRLSKPRRAYSGPYRPDGGEWRNDADTSSMVEEALTLAAATSADQFPASEFDLWDPSDYDQDGITDEPDGYLDHFVIVYAGGAQSSCQSLNKIGSVLTANVGNEAVEKLDKRQRECADRPWPHRSSVRQREGKGPKIADTVNRRGGVPISDSLWIYDYNMQSETTSAATFIHEFGHSIGLPDVYSRTSSNSTGSWAVMSSDTRPNPQGMSAWSRVQLGWLKPKVVLPPKYGGSQQGSIPLARLDDAEVAADRAILVVLPPKQKILELTDELPEGSEKALYGGQGNELSNTAEHVFDLTGATAASLSFDAWWEIEAGWDFTYIEVSTDAGASWTRQIPSDRKFMPAKHGHDGKKSLPGLTGLSGDFDGDGKNESNTACDPSVDVKTGEDKAGEKEKNPCLEPTWVRPSFDLAPFLGLSDVRVRIRYYTDGAAVMRGFLFDNPSLSVAKGGEATETALGDFESDVASWTVKGFSSSPGRHEILVPHYYLVEYRDPYATEGYDKNLARSSVALYDDPKTGDMNVVEFRRRPGVVLWYADGSFAWSENDPAINGPGKGYALVVDSSPNEVSLPGFEDFLGGSPDAFNTSYDVTGEAAQEALAKSYQQSVCFIRNRKYHPRGEKVRCKSRKPKLAKLKIGGEQAIYSYELYEWLPEKRLGYRGVSELVDTRTRKGVKSFRLRDRGLRYYHTFDAPFSIEPFADGVIYYKVDGDELKKVNSVEHPAVTKFNDSTPQRWLNPKLPFGGAAVPSVGFSFEIEKGNGDAAVEFKYRFRE